MGGVVTSRKHICNHYLLLFLVVTEHICRPPLLCAPSDFTAGDLGSLHIVSMTLGCTSLIQLAYCFDKASSLHLVSKASICLAVS